MKEANPLRRLVLAAACLLATVLAARSGVVGDDEAPQGADKPVPVKPEEAHRPTLLPDRVILTWKDDPARSQAVTWRTGPHVKRPQAEIALAEDGPYFTAYGKKKDAAGKVRTVPATTAPLQTDLGLAHYHTAHFTGLEPKTRYVYRVGDGVNWSEWFQFQTAAATAEPFTFLYFGDAQNDIKAHWSRVIRQAYATAPEARFLLHAGDLINRANNDAEWGEWFQAGGWLNGTLPSVPTPGNHEYFNANAPSRSKKEEDEPARGANTARAAAPPYKGELSRHWKQVFALPDHGPEGLKGTVYYLDYQGVRLVSLNSNESARSHADKERQVPWLEQVLANNPNRWTVVTFHHPVFSTARNRDNPDLRRLWQPVFDKYRVDLVLTGHDHSYGRSGLVTVNAPDGTHARDGRGGTVYCVSVSGPKMYDLNQQDWMARSAEGTQLYQVIRVDGATLRYQAHTATGELYDVFELRKRADGTNELVEGEQLDYEAARWLRFGGLTRGQSAWAAAALFGLAGLLLARRWLRRRVRAA